MEILRKFLQTKVSRRGFLVGAVVGGATAFGFHPPRAKAGELTTPPAFLDVEVLMYHEIGSKKLTSDLMARINSGSQPISTETFVRAFNGEVILPPGQRLFFLTLDDGRASQYPAALEATRKVLDDTGMFVPATFFAITKFGDPLVPMEEVPGNTPCYRSEGNSYMTKDQLIDLIKWDLAGRDKPFNLLAYPYGRYNAEQVDFLDSIGYDLAFSERRVSHHLSSERLFLGRINMPA